MGASPGSINFFCCFFRVFFGFDFTKCFSLPSVFRHSAKALPSARQIALGKEPFAVNFFAVCPLPSVTLGKVFAECISGFAECLGYSAKPVNPVVNHDSLKSTRLGFL